MKKNKKNNKERVDPYENLVLDEYEQMLEESLARGEWEPVENLEEVKDVLQEAAATHRIFQDSRKITVRVNQGDLVKLKVKAKQSNIPYQTLLQALIRDFVKGDYKIVL